MASSRAGGRHKPPSRKGRVTRPPADLAVRLAAGESYSSIAIALGVDRDAVSRWAHTPEMEADVARLRAELAEEGLRRVSALQTKALDRLAGVLADGVCEHCGRGPGEDKDVLKGVELVLDRSGLPKQTKVDVTGGLDLGADGKPDEQLERDILLEAAQIARERGRQELAGELEALARPPEPPAP